MSSYFLSFIFCCKDDGMDECSCGMGCNMRVYLIFVFHRFEGNFLGILMCLIFFRLVSHPYMCINVLILKIKSNRYTCGMTEVAFSNLDLQSRF
jgi:hypothetical protein